MCKTNNRFSYIRTQYKHGIHDTVKDGTYRKGYRTTYDDFDLDKITDELNIRENKINQLTEENETLRKDLIDYSALVQMLESCTGLSIEDILYNKTGAESQEEFNKIHKTYHDKAKQWWGKEE